MAFTFRIIFSGISAFVPDVPFNSLPPNSSPPNSPTPSLTTVLVPNSPTPGLMTVHFHNSPTPNSPTPDSSKPNSPKPSLMTVLFPNVLSPRLPAQTFCNHDELQARIVASHYPIIQFNMKNLRSTQGLQDFFIRERSTGENSRERIGVGCLVNQDISVLPDGQPLGHGKLTLIDDKPVDPDNPTPEEEQSLFWLQKVGDVLGKPSTIDPRFLGSLPRNRDIITRIRFSTGRLQTAGLSDVKVEFLPFGGPAKVGLGRKIATKLALEFEAEEKVKLVFREFGSTDGTTKLVFVPSEDEPEEDVEIRLDNLEPETLLGVPATPGVRADVLVDPDFAVYYDLVDGLSTAPQILVPHHALAENEDILGIGKPCSPAGIDGKATG